MSRVGLASISDASIAARAALVGGQAGVTAAQYAILWSNFRGELLYWLSQPGVLSDVKSASDFLQQYKT